MADASTIDALRSQFQSRLAAAGTDRAIKALDDEFLGRKSGSVTALMQTLKGLPQEERRAFGAAVNALKTYIEGALQEQRAALESSRPPAGSVASVGAAAGVRAGRADVMVVDRMGLQIGTIINHNPFHPQRPAVARRLCGHVASQCSSSCTRSRLRAHPRASAAGAGTEPEPLEPS